MNAAIEKYFIVYVEDDASNRRVMSMLLEKTLKTTRYAIFENSANFDERLNNLPEPPCIFLLDIHVKPLDGFEMLKAIRAHAAYEKSIVLAITASVTNEEVDKLRDSGFDGAIGKPIDLFAFPELIERAINGEAVWSIS